MSNIVRIIQKSYEQLSRLENESDCSKQVIEKLSREKFMQNVVRDYDLVGSNANPCEEELEERAEWESLSDKFEDL